MPRRGTRTCKSNSQPSRWRKGDEAPGLEVTPRLLALDYVLAVAVQVWDPTVVKAWLTTANAFLDGARPIDVAVQRGPAEVVDALQATLSGADA